MRRHSTDQLNEWMIFGSREGCRGIGQHTVKVIGYCRIKRRSMNPSQGLGGAVEPREPLGGFGWKGGWNRATHVAIEMPYLPITQGCPCKQRLVHEGLVWYLASSLPCSALGSDIEMNSGFGAFEARMPAAFDRSSGLRNVVPWSGEVESKYWWSFPRNGLAAAAKGSGCFRWMRSGSHLRPGCVVLPGTAGAEWAVWTLRGMTLRDWDETIFWKIARLP
jgi:hypothetical protein